MSREEANIAREFPLHYFVWTKNIVALRSSLQPDNVNFQHLEQLDPRGRTPLMLAVTLENLDCAILLLESGANVNVENKEGWTGIVLIVRFLFIGSNRHVCLSFLQLSRKLFQQVILKSLVQFCRREIFKGIQPECLGYLHYFKNSKRYFYIILLI